jgi:hypothetical protein
MKKDDNDGFTLFYIACQQGYLKVMLIIIKLF